MTTNTQCQVEAYCRQFVLKATGEIEKIKANPFLPRMIIG
ncbi:MAG: hypothetical protein ACJAS1_003314 [Oleiphilaceae bacterium]